METFLIIPHIAALAGAYALALPIGWERQLAERSAGLRTFPLVALASCGFVQASEELLEAVRSLVRVERRRARLPRIWLTGDP